MVDMHSLLPQYRPDEFDSRHRLVQVAAQRAKQLIQGARPAFLSKFTKEAAIALDEVLNGHVEFLSGQEARQAMKDGKRGRDGETERMAVVAGEDAQEIKKELSVYVDDSSKALEPTEGEE
jgi:DNA-directed RNA polymerase subunit omega